MLRRMTAREVIHNESKVADVIEIKDTVVNPRFQWHRAPVVDYRSSNDNSTILAPADNSSVQLGAYDSERQPLPSYSTSDYGAAAVGRDNFSKNTKGGNFGGQRTQMAARGGRGIVNNSAAVAEGQERNCNCGEPAVLRTTVKEGVNKGRQFYCCPKPRL